MRFIKRITELRYQRVHNGSASSLTPPASPGVRDVDRAGGWKLTRRTLLGVLFVTAAVSAVPASLKPVSAAGSSASDTTKVGERGELSSVEALSLARSGDLMIIDVRSPAEWHQTGLPAGARPVTIHDPKGLKGFVRAVEKAVGGMLGRPIALICASGNRSAIGRRALMASGFTRVFDVGEGMLGNSRGPGWLARNLPVEDCGQC